MLSNALNLTLVVVYLENIYVIVYYGSPEKQKPMHKEIYYKELVYAIMETDKSQDMQSSSWRQRRVDGIVTALVSKQENQES